METHEHGHRFGPYVPYVKACNVTQERLYMMFLHLRLVYSTVCAPKCTCDCVHACRTDGVWLVPMNM